MSEAPLSILYRDEHLVAIDKPEGLLVHRSLIDRSEKRYALQLLRDQLGQRVYPAHRLDRPTSGVLLFALDRETARRLGEIFSGREASKRYLALVRGWAPECLRIDHPLKEELDRTTDSLADGDKEPQSAVTGIRTLERFELDAALGRYPRSRYSLVEAMPETGRKHQIRRHLKHIFHPVIGDTTHGEGRHNRFFRETLDCGRMLLAAVELSLLHPVTGENLEIRGGPGRQFEAVLERLRREGAVSAPV